MFLKDRWGPFLDDAVFVGVLGVEGSGVGNFPEADLINAEKADFFDTTGVGVDSSSDSESEEESDEESEEDESSECVSNDDSFVIDCDLSISTGFGSFSSSWLLSEDESLSDELSDVSVKWNSFLGSDSSLVSTDFFSGWGSDWGWGCGWGSHSDSSDDSESEES